MNEKDVPDDRPGPETETAQRARVAGTHAAANKPSPSETADDDTEGHGGKVFAVPEADAEGVAGD